MTSKHAIRSSDPWQKRSACDSDNINNITLRDGTGDNIKNITLRDATDDNIKNITLRHGRSLKLNTSTNGKRALGTYDRRRPSPSHQLDFVAAI